MMPKILSEMRLKHSLTVVELFGSLKAFTFKRGDQQLQNSELSDL